MKRLLIALAVVISCNHVTGNSGVIKGVSDWNASHSFLLKRDLDPASNDDSPVGLNEAA